MSNRSLKIVQALSGGLDSAVLLGDYLRGGHVVYPVTFLYGSRHNSRESAMASKLADHFHVTDRHRRVDVVKVFQSMGASDVAPSALFASGPDVPTGHYNEETMRQTVVPGRNTIFAAILLGIAESLGADIIALGVHAGDHFIYPDCRPEWVDAMAQVVRAASDEKVMVEAPFMRWSKAAIVRRGLDLGVPFLHTRTCYTDNHIACGRCGSCQERLEAFEKNGVEDPIDYANRELIPKT